MAAIRYEGRIHIGSSYESIQKWKYDFGFIKGGELGFIDDDGKFISKENLEEVVPDLDQKPTGKSRKGKG